MADILRSAGLKVVCHNDHFEQEEEDHVWIPRCARQGWIIITSDKGIETDPINRGAVMDSKAIVFILEDGCSRAASWAASLIVSRDRIYQAVINHPPPFFMTVSRQTASLVKQLRRPCPVPDSATGATMLIHASSNDIEMEIAAKQQVQPVPS
jgi:hypothetical protein